MKYESMLASRYIKAQKRQSAFTAVSIIAAVAVITMIFNLYSVFMDCMERTAYSQAPYHLMFGDLTEEQAMSLKDEGHVRSLKLQEQKDGKVTAFILFDSDIGDNYQWLQNAALKIGADDQFVNGKYKWNDTLLLCDQIGNNAVYLKLVIFSIFFIWAVIFAFALRLVIDTAFEISSKERERHYGVLQSIGATPEQIVRIITYEGLKLCVTAIPFGLAAGAGFSYLMYNALLAAGLKEIFKGMTSAKLNLPFSVDPLMLLISAVVGVVWVFLSAYGVGMRIIKKSPMEAITARANDVRKVRKRTLSGMLFGITGSIASRNARRQKKRFIITVLTLTVSMTLFALFSTLVNNVDKGVSTLLTGGIANFEYMGDLKANNVAGTTYKDGYKELSESGLFKNIGLEKSYGIAVKSGDTKLSSVLSYVNRDEYARIFGDDPAVSYDELVSSGGYVVITNSNEYESLNSDLSGDTAGIICMYYNVPEDDFIENIDYEYLRVAGTKEPREHEIKLIGKMPANKSAYFVFSAFVGAIETYDSVKYDYFSNYDETVECHFDYNSTAEANATDAKKADDWFKEHLENISVMADFYSYKVMIHNVLSTISTGALILNIFLALTALINLLNIISTGIANRRSELASLQCVGMTDKQLRRMAVIECLQFTVTAAIISALICGLVVFGIEYVLAPMLSGIVYSEGEERTEMQKMLTDMMHIDKITPFVRIAAASLTAFAAGCITALVMLRVQSTDSLSEQIRGSEMKLDTKKSHLLRNSVIAVVSAAVIAVTGLRIYSVVSYHSDRKEYEKAGYLNLVDSNGFKMNVYSTGAKNGKHTIVGIAGMGVHCYPILTQQLNERLGKENTLVYPDRAGYGFSDDSFKSQTLEQVVEDYRTGLKNAGFEAPYVLMPHSYGDFYALWWQAKYPDEVEAIVFMDCTWLDKNEYWETWSVNDYPSESEFNADIRRIYMRTWLGLDRLFPIEEETDGTFGRSVLTQEQIELMELTDKRACSAALISNMKNEPYAAQELRDILKPTDTPKLYFSTMASCEEDLREGLEFQKADYEASGLEYKLGPETAAKSEWQSYGWEYRYCYENGIKPFLEKCGNCRLVSIGGEHSIFHARKPDKVADTILDFLSETTE